MNDLRTLTLLAIVLFVFGLVTGCVDDRRRDRGDGPVVVVEPDAGDLSDTHVDPPDTDEPPSTPTCDACTPNQVCVLGVCEDLPASCPCPAETYCNLADNTCVVGCIADTDCATGRICFSEQRQCRDGCRADTDCGQGRICDDVNLVCRAGCRADAACSAGQICEATRCESGCRQDAECGAGHICEELQCRVGCRNNDGCNGVLVCDDTRKICRSSVLAGVGSYRTGGVSRWKEITTDDGFAALESGEMPRDGGASWIAVDVEFTQPTVLAFDWTVSTPDSGFNYLTFCRNASCSFVSRITGPMFTRENGVLTDITWQTKTIEYPAGSHRLEWRYERSLSSGFEDRGWVKNVRLLSPGSEPGAPLSFTNSQRYDIPDNNQTGVSSPIVVNAEGVVQAVRIDVDIVHSYRGDLTLYLEHDFESVAAYSGSGSQANIELTDHEVFGFEGHSAAGTWTLRVVDSASTDTGYLRSWTLHLEVE
jgi:hypothetical protein